MVAVDRNVLRIAVAELLERETPAAVVIDEAIEIARRYGTAQSSDFVNGVLDALRESLPPASEIRDTTAGDTGL